jgi:hypothetical protein
MGVIRRTAPISVNLLERIILGGQTSRPKRDPKVEQILSEQNDKQKPAEHTKEKFV